MLWLNFQKLLQNSPSTVYTNGYVWSSHGVKLNTKLIIVAEIVFIQEYTSIDCSIKGKVKTLNVKIEKA